MLLVFIIFFVYCRATITAITLKEEKSYSIGIIDESNNFIKKGDFDLQIDLESGCMCFDKDRNYYGVIAMNETYTEIIILTINGKIISKFNVKGVMFGNIEYYNKKYILTGYSILDDKNFLYDYDLNKNIINKILIIPGSIQPGESYFSSGMLYLVTEIRRQMFILIIDINTLMINSIKVDYYPSIISVYQDNIYYWYTKNEISKLLVISNNITKNILTINNCISSGGMMIFNGSSIAYNVVFHIDDNNIKEFIVINDVSKYNNLSKIEIQYEIIAIYYNS